MELRTSRLIETCSNSFKDKTEDGWVVTRAKTKVSGRLNFLPLSKMCCMVFHTASDLSDIFARLQLGSSWLSTTKGGSRSLPLQLQCIVLTYMQSLLKKSYGQVRILKGKLFSLKTWPFSGFSYLSEKLFLLQPFSHKEWDIVWNVCWNNWPVCRVVSYEEKC